MEVASVQLFDVDCILPDSKKRHKHRETSPEHANNSAVYCQAGTDKMDPQKICNLLGQPAAREMELKYTQQAMMDMLKVLYTG